MPFNKICVKQSGVIAYLCDGDILRFALITSRTNEKAWIFPKGKIEDGMTPSESAQKEAFEEAGVLGKIISGPIGTYSYEKSGAFYEVELFLLSITKILKQWPEDSQRKRIFATFEESNELLKDSSLLKALKKTSCFISRHGKEI